MNWPERYTNADLEICQYLRLCMEKYVEDFTLKHLLLFEISTREISGRFVYKHSETIEYVKNWPTFKKNLQISRANNSRVLRIKNSKFWEYCFYLNTNIQGDYQICISVPKAYCINVVLDGMLIYLNRRYLFKNKIYFYFCYFKQYNIKMWHALSWSNPAVTLMINI